MAVVYAIHPIYENDEIYAAYDSDFREWWTGDENIKREMVAYYAGLEEEKRRVKARERKVKDNRPMKTTANLDGMCSRNEAGVLPRDTVRNRRSRREPIKVEITVTAQGTPGGRYECDSGVSGQALVVAIYQFYNLYAFCYIHILYNYAVSLFF